MSTINELVRNGYSTMVLPGWPRGQYIQVDFDDKGQMTGDVIIYGQSSGQTRGSLADFEAHNAWMGIGTSDKNLAMKMQSQKKLEVEAFDTKKIDPELAGDISKFGQPAETGSVGGTGRTGTTVGGPHTSGGAGMGGVGGSPAPAGGASHGHAHAAGGGAGGHKSPAKDDKK